MCRRVKCSKCGKPTWAGCGAHIEQVLGSVPAADRCKCREAPRAAKPEPKAAAGAHVSPSAAAPGASPDTGGVMSKFIRFIKGGS